MMMILAFKLWSRIFSGSVQRDGIYCSVGSHASFVSDGMVWPAQVDLTIVVVLVRQGHFKAAIKYF
jgi:hypothetical protein